MATSFWSEPLETRGGQWALIIIVLAVFGMLGWYMTAAQPRPLQALDPNYGWATDGNYVYYQDRPIFGAEPRTFVPLPWGYGKDAKRVYFQGIPRLGVDPATFVLLSYDFSKDARRVYYGEYEIPGADPATFEVLAQSYYGRDKANIYFRDQIVRGADLASFEVIDYYTYGANGRDANQLYNDGQPVTEEEASANLESQQPY